MRDVVYQVLDFSGANTKMTRRGPLLEFVYNMVGVTENGIIPPLAILNSRLLSGGECNPFGNTAWDPFSITLDEYEALCAAAASTEPSAISSYKNLAFVKLRCAPELDAIEDPYEWSKAVRNHYSDEYVDNLIRLNSSDNNQSADIPESSDLSVESKDDAKSQVERPDLEKIRRDLIRLSSSSIQRFAELHHGESFYALGFDLNSEYGDVLLCTNTESKYRTMAQLYKRNHDYSDGELSDLKSEIGHWKYHGFNLDQDDWVTGWQSSKQAIERFVFSDETSLDDAERFTKELISICSSVLLELEKAGQFDALMKEPDFYLFCVDHDEGMADAAERFERLRREYFE